MKKTIYKVIRAILIALIVYIIGWLWHVYNRESSIPYVDSEPFDIQKIIKVEVTPIAEAAVETLNEREIIAPVDIAETYRGYEVCAQLQIPAINLETYILDDYTKEKMDACPTKYRGPEPNEVGNFCIVGHNYKDMFIDLINLEIGDELYLLDNKNGKTRYTIYNIYRVKPTNTECLNQDTEGKRIVTLISCVNYADLRIIIKAVEEVN